MDFSSQKEKEIPLHKHAKEDDAFSTLVKKVRLLERFARNIHNVIYFNILDGQKIIITSLL